VGDERGFGDAIEVAGAGDDVDGPIGSDGLEGLDVDGGAGG